MQLHAVEWTENGGLLCQRKLHLSPYMEWEERNLTITTRSRRNSRADWERYRTTSTLERCITKTFSNQMKIGYGIALLARSAGTRFGSSYYLVLPMQPASR